MKDLVHEVKSSLRYNPKTGEMFWKKTHSYRKQFSGRLAGGIRKELHVFRHKIKLNGTVHNRSRLAFILMTGTIPPMVDHINRDTTDDRWVNLRAATRSQNRFNLGNYKKKSGLPMGVSLGWKRNPHNVTRYRAEIMLNKEKFFLGHFKTVSEARAAYLTAKEKLHGEFLGRKK